MTIWIKPLHLATLLKKVSFTFTRLALVPMSIVLLFNGIAQALDKPPILLFASAKAGPNTGWPGVSNKGAAITVWGRNLDDGRGDSSLTVCGVTLDADADFIEWGGADSPKTPEGIGRITFHLTGAMSGTGGIQATVDGRASNVLSFSITSTGAIHVYPDDSAANGWGDVDDALESMNPGDFLYFRSGTYSFYEYIGYSLTENNGTDANRITMTAYPGETPVFGPGYLRIHSQYWTFANLYLDRFFFQMGGQRDFCTGAINRHGLRLVGCEFTGNADHALQAFGHDFEILGNYVDLTPGDDTAYPFYLCSGDNRTVSHNEIHGGSRWSMHVYDEDRPNCADEGRVLRDWIIEGNIMNATDVGLGYRGALIVQANNVARVENITVKNNLLYANGTTPTEAQIRIRHNVDGVNIYNNTIHAGAVGVVITDAIPDNVDIRNNIFSAISDEDVKNEATGSTVLVTNNLYDGAPSWKNVSDSNPIVGDIHFVDAGAGDFRVTTGSDAIDKGLPLADVTIDLEGIARPQLAGYDLGAYEYTDGAVSSGNNNGSNTSTNNQSSNQDGGGSGGGCFVRTIGGMH